MTPNLGILRSAIAPMLTDTAAIFRQTGQTVQNEETGIEEPVFAAVYSGPVLVRPERTVEVNVGGLEFSQGKYDVTLPAETGASVGDLVEVTASIGDTALVGMVLSLTDVPADSYQVARFCKAEQAV